MSVEMQTIFLQNLSGGLFGGIFGGILKGLLKNRLNGLFTRTPTVAVLLLTAVIAACASDSKSSNPTTTTPPTTTPPDCTFAEDVGGSTDCGLLTLTQNLNSTTYDITVGEVLAGQEVNTDKLGLSNFTFIEIINGSASDSQLVGATPLTFSENATALNVTISGIANNVFGEFYIELVKSDDASVKVRYTISITPVNDAPTIPPSYNFDGIPLNSPAGYSVGNVSVTDIDNDTITYSIIGGTDVTNLFQISAATGELATGSARGEITLKVMATNSGPYTFNVIANDGNGGSAMAVITVRVLPADTTPPVFTPTSYSFDLLFSEANDGAVVGNVLATDVTPFDYSLRSAGDLFGRADAKNADGSINITLLRDAILNDFVSSSVTFQVVATHQGGGISSMAEVTVNLINDDDTDGDGIKGFYDAFPDNAAVNVTGSGNSSHPYIISNIYQLQAIAGVDHEGTALDSSTFTNNSFLYGTDAADQLTKHYILADDIDASDTAVWAKPAVTTYVGRGWTPIAGNSSQSFSGSFSGEGYAISNLSMFLRAAAITDTFGLFGTNSGNISAVGLANIEMRIQVVGGNALDFDSDDSGVDTTNIPNVGSGGLIGENEQTGIIQYSYVSGFVNATADKVGALVGSNQGEISYSYSTAAVEGRLDAGGLVGSNTAGGRVLSSYATGDVNGDYGIRGGSAYDSVVGALVGHIDVDASNVVNASYATGVPTFETSDEFIGSLVGQLGLITAIASSYWYNNPDITVMGIGNLDDSIVEGHRGLSNAQLQGCGLGGIVIAGASPVPTTCTDLFPTSNWGNTTITTTDGDIERGWIFNANEYPSLFAVGSSDNKQLFPSAAEQECHRNGMPLGCE